MSRRPWHVVSLLWKMLNEILLPLAFCVRHGAAEFLERVVRRLEHNSRRKRRPRQIESVRAILSPFRADNHG
jgi:hypothetical protein